MHIYIHTYTHVLVNLIWVRNTYTSKTVIIQFCFWNSVVFLKEILKGSKYELSFDMQKSFLN